MVLNRGGDVVVQKKPRVVLLDLGRWPMVAGLPRALSKAGFAVVVIAYSGSFVAKSCFVTTHIELKSTTLLPAQIIWNLLSQAPDFVVPCDDSAVRILRQITHEISRRTPWMVPGRVRTLIERSIGAPTTWSLHHSRFDTQQTFCAADIPTVEYADTLAQNSAIAFAERVGYPVVLKLDDTAGGNGVRICHGPADLLRHHAELLKIHQHAETQRNSKSGLSRFLFGRPKREPHSMIGQSYVHGGGAMRLFLSLNGREVAGLSVVVKACGNDGLGPSTVIEFIDHPEMTKASRNFAETVGYSGFGSIDFVIDGVSGQARAIEFNARTTIIGHMGEMVGADMPLALRSALEGRTEPPVSNDAGRIVTLFPREWLRDPESANLRDHIVDFPWDDPELADVLLSYAQNMAGENVAPVDLSVFRRPD
jgi:hypothetical protein